MKLYNKAYNIIYRIRRRSNSPEINTKERTIYLPAGTDENDLSRPVLRLINEFKFIGQMVIKI